MVLHAKTSETRFIIREQILKIQLKEPNLFWCLIAGQLRNEAYKIFSNFIFNHGLCVYFFASWSSLFREEGNLVTILDSGHSSNTKASYKTVIICPSNSGFHTYTHKIHSTPRKLFAIVIVLASTKTTWRLWPGSKNLIFWVPQYHKAQQLSSLVVC